MWHKAVWIEHPIKLIRKCLLTNSSLEVPSSINFMLHSFFSSVKIQVFVDFFAFFHFFSVVCWNSKISWMKNSFLNEHYLFARMRGYECIKKNFESHFVGYMFVKNVFITSLLWEFFTATLADGSYESLSPLKTPGLFSVFWLILIIL